MSAPIRLGNIDLSFHAASAAVVQRLLERHGHDVETVTAPHEEMFRRYGAGEVDMLISAWLPASHGGYLGPFAHETRKLGLLYQPYCIWGVPDYVPEADVASVEDLRKPEVAERMSRLIQGINPGAGISRFSREMVTAYGLDGLGYHFETGSEEGCFSRFEHAVVQKEWLVVPLWHPQFLHYRYRIRELAEPKGLLGGRDDARLIVHETVARTMSGELLETLSTLALGNAVVSELDYRICREGMTPLAAADRWLDGARKIGAA